MIDMEALLRGLPVSGLEPDFVARLDGMFTGEKFGEYAGSKWHNDVLWLLEPPAGRRVPYVVPVDALYVLLRAGGAMPESAHTQVAVAAALLRQETAAAPWFTCFDNWGANSPECLPAPDLLHWLRYTEHGRALQLPSALLNMLEQASEAALETTFTSEKYPTQRFTLETLPELPLPKCMIEFVPGPFWDEEEYDEEGDDFSCWLDKRHPFFRWRESMLPIAARLEDALGEEAYYFADLHSEFDRDSVHRFLMLHWCCSYRPQSSFVRYLLDISGAAHVDELKAALIDPTSFTHPFEMNDGIGTLETFTIPRFEWKKPVGERS